jgi:pimeloyl-ACP methyl ester carboxylesterase
MFLRCPKETTKMLIYFHGNAEDLGRTKCFMKMIQAKLDVHIIVVEYPGYGVYEGDVNEDKVFSDAKRVIEFVKNVLFWNTKDVIVMGRSIGSGPACYLASTYKIGALVLISPYTSIRGVVKYMFGRLSQYLIKERFRNYEMMGKVKCPTFILHGEQDRVIPIEHSRTLSSICKGETCLIVSETMDHSWFDFELEFMNPLKEFLRQNNLKTAPPHLPSTCNQRSGFLFTRPYFSYLKGPNRDPEFKDCDPKWFNPQSKILPNRETMIGKEIPEDWDIPENEYGLKKVDKKRSYRRSTISSISTYVSPQKPKLELLW